MSAGFGCAVRTLSYVLPTRLSFHTSWLNFVTFSSKSSSFAFYRTPGPKRLTCTDIVQYADSTNSPSSKRNHHVRIEPVIFGLAAEHLIHWSGLRVVFFKSDISSIQYTMLRTSLYEPMLFLHNPMTLRHYRIVLAQYTETRQKLRR